MNNKVEFIISFHKKLDARAKALESKVANLNERSKLFEDRQWILRDTDNYLCRSTPKGKSEVFEALLKAFQ